MLAHTDTLDQLFKRSFVGVLQNRVLSHFQFAQYFYLNTIHRGQFSKAYSVDWKSTYFLKVTH